MLAVPVVVAEVVCVCALGTDAVGVEVEQFTDPLYAPEVRAEIECVCVADPPVVPYVDDPNGKYPFKSEYCVQPIGGTTLVISIIPVGAFISLFASP